MRTVLLTLTLVTISVVGCKPEESITVHTVPKSVSGLDSLRQSTGPFQSSAPQNSDASTPTRMVVALFQRDDAAWFFKITGPPDAVESTASQWQSFIDQLKFDIVDGVQRPVWKLSDGWKEGPPAPFRFATIQLPDSEIEIRISKLGGQQNLLSNVNRWRASQLGLAPATEKTLDENLEEKTGPAGNYLLFDQQGTGSGSMNPMGGPFANRARPSTQTPPAVTEPKSASATPARQFDLVPPVGFEAGKTSPMVVARFVQQTDQGNVQITVVPLTSINQWNTNVNFWRKSVGLEELPDEKIETQTQSITVSGIEGKRIELLEDDDGSDKGLIGVMVKKDDLAWFFKMIGPRPMVRENKSKFDKFLTEFSFKP